jgi:hypothetical protein
MSWQKLSLFCENGAAFAGIVEYFCGKLEAGWQNEEGSSEKPAGVRQKKEGAAQKLEAFC